jgi:hypothetical protein
MVPHGLLPFAYAFWVSFRGYARMKPFL